MNNPLVGIHGYYETEEQFINSEEFKKLPSFARDSLIAAFRLNNQNQAYINQGNDITNAAIQALKDLEAKLEKEEKEKQELIAKQKAKEELDKKLAEEHAANVKRELVGQAQEFDAKKAGLAQGLMGIAGEDARLSLADQKKIIAQNAARRGLYYSGIKEKALADVQDLAQQDLMAKQIAVNEDIQAQSDAYNQLAAQGVRDNEQLIFGNAAQKQQNALNNYQQGLQARRARLASKSGTRSLLAGSDAATNRFRDYLDGNEQSGYAPEVFGAIGHVAGRGIEGYYNSKRQGLA